jgi:hypothetical protein
LYTVTAPRPHHTVAQLTPQLAISTTSLILATRYLERIWGFVELVRFSLIVVVLSNVVAFGFSWIAWFILGQDEFMWVSNLSDLSDIGGVGSASYCERNGTREVRR